MNGKRTTLFALAGAVLLVAGAAAEQAKPAATPAVQQAAAVQPQPTAAPTRLAPPVRGSAELGYTKPVTKNDGKFLTTTMKVKNMSQGAIAGLKIDYILYDKGANPVTGDTFRARKPLQPGEVLDVMLKVPVNKAAVRDAYNFQHANGEIKPKLVPKV